LVDGGHKDLSAIAIETGYSIMDDQAKKMISKSPVLLAG
jgi:hypothetical protein